MQSGSGSRGAALRALRRLSERARKPPIAFGSVLWCCAERILNPGEWLRNVHVEATKAAVCQDTPGVGPVYAPRTPGIASLSEDRLCPAPDVGQDSYDILIEAGLDRGAIDDLVKAGAVRQAKGDAAS